MPEVVGTLEAPDRRNRILSMLVSFKEAKAAEAHLVSDPMQKRAVGPPLIGIQLDARLEKAIKGEEPVISASDALAKIRRRHRL